MMLLMVSVTASLGANDGLEGCAISIHSGDCSWPEEGSTRQCPGSVVSTFIARTWLVVPNAQSVVAPSACTSKEKTNFEGAELLAELREMEALLRIFVMRSVSVLCALPSLRMVFAPTKLTCNGMCFCPR